MPTPQQCRYAAWAYLTLWQNENGAERRLRDRLEEAPHEALMMAAHYFGVAGTLPKHPDALSAIFRSVLNADLEPENLYARRDRIEQLSENAYNVACNIDHTPQRPRSFMSKILMLRFPNSAFVYDTNARSSIGHMFGHRPSTLNSFVNLWAKHIRPIVNDLTKNNNFSNSGDAARIVDKILWIHGRKEEKRHKHPAGYECYEATNYLGNVLFKNVPADLQEHR